MLAFIGKALKIALLVILGLIFILNIPEIISIIKGECKNMNKNVIAGKVCKCVGGLAVVLGLAFYGGSMLAKVQGVILQIVPLAVTGTVCIIAGLVSFIIGRNKIKKAGN